MERNILSHRNKFKINNSDMYMWTRQQNIYFSCHEFIYTEPNLLPQRDSIQDKTVDPSMNKKSGFVQETPLQIDNFK